MREFKEETGVSVRDSQLLGTLSELFISPSQFLVRPFVACAEDRPEFDPDPVEVEQIIELPVSALMNEETVKRGRVRLSTDVVVKGHAYAGANTIGANSTSQRVVNGIGRRR